MKMPSRAVHCSVEVADERESFLGPIRALSLACDMQYPLHLILKINFSYLRLLYYLLLYLIFTLNLYLVLIYCTIWEFSNCNLLAFF